MGIFKLFFLLLILSPLKATCENLPSKIWPPVLTLRPEGISQVDQTCIAASLLISIENHFQRINKPIKLSQSYFIYAFKAKIFNHPYHEERFELTEEEINKIDKHGCLLPSLLLPEEHRYSYPPCQDSVFRLLSPVLADIPENFLSPTPVLIDHFIQDINHLKNLVHQNKIFTLHVPGDIGFLLFPKVTGKEKSRLFRKEKSKVDVYELDNEKVNEITHSFIQNKNVTGRHGVSVVGYDDDLYQNLSPKGGLIIKGTWDTFSIEYSSIPYKFLQKAIELTESRINLGKKALSLGLMFAMELQFDDGFEEEFLRAYHSAEKSAHYDNVYIPYFLSTKDARIASKKFNQVYSTVVDPSNLSIDVKNDLESVINEINYEYAFVAVLPSVEIYDSFYDFYDLLYKPNKTVTIFPSHQMFGVPNLSIIFKSPNSIDFWAEFFKAVDYWLSLLEEEREEL